MTTIACHEGWLIADGRFTSGGEIIDDECEKIVETPTGLILSGAGHGSQLEEFLFGSHWDTFEWSQMGSPNMPKKLLKMMRKCVGWIHRPGDKHLWEVGYHQVIPLPVKGFTQALGSGSVYYKGAAAALSVAKSDLGLSNRQVAMAAMEAAKKCDIYTGGKVTLRKLRT